MFLKQWKWSSSFPCPLAARWEEAARRRIFSLAAGGGTEGLDEVEDTSGQAQVALILEVEGVLADLHKFGHRVAFNKAFQELGLDVPSWTPSVYADLLRQAGGSEENMLGIYFGKAGWPSSVAPAKKYFFVEQLLKLKHSILEAAVAEGSVPLRPGLEQFIDEALAAGVPVAVVTAYSKCGETVAWDLVKRLGPERAGAIVRVGKEEVEASTYGQVVLGGGATSGLEEALANQIAEAVATEKQRLAEEVAKQLKVTVELDTGSGRLLRRGVAALRAAAELVGVEAQRCVVLAGSHSALQAAQTGAFPCVVMRSSITARAEFPQARAAMEGFGAGALTVARLLRLVQQPSSQTR